MRRARARAEGACPGRGRGAQVTAPTGIAGLARVQLFVDHGTRCLGVVGPRSPIEIVGADNHPHVVYDAHLGVDIDGPARLRLEVVDRDAVPPGRLKPLDRALLTDAVRRPRHPAVAVGEAWHHGDDTEPRRATKRLGQRGRRLRRPEVLILDIDELARLRERLEICARDTPLAGAANGYTGRRAGYVRSICTAWRP